MSIKSLNELFTTELEGISLSNTLHEKAIPICQHNIYKYSPVHVRDDGEDSFTLFFPETQLPHAKLLEITGLDSPIPYQGPLPRMDKMKAKEGEGKAKFTMKFKSSANCSIEQVLEQFYLTHVNSYNLDLYYEPLKGVKCKQKAVLPEAKFISLSTKQVQQIVTLHKQSHFGKYVRGVMDEIRSLALEISEEFDWLPCGLSRGDRFFWKMTTRSAKDSWYYKEMNMLASINKEAQTKKPLHKCEAETAVDVIAAMVGSSRVSSDCESFLQWKVSEQQKNPLKIVIQRWVDFPEEMEFRCFAFNGQITAINQLCWSKYIDYLDTDKEFQSKILRSIQELFLEVKDLLPWDNYIMDVIYDIENDCAQICEFNPWGPYSCTGSQLFSWELDFDIIFRTTPGCSPEFRVLRPWMKVEEQFSLRLDDSMMPAISPLFWTHILSSTPRCPCCKRPSDPVGYQLPETKLRQ